MAYYKDLLTRECDTSGCHIKATKEVFNNRNASFGWFCTAHAKSKVTNINKTENLSGTETGRFRVTEPNLSNKPRMG